MAYTPLFATTTKEDKKKQTTGYQRLFSDTGEEVDKKPNIVQIETVPINKPIVEPVKTLKQKLSDFFANGGLIGQYFPKPSVTPEQAQSQLQQSREQIVGAGKGVAQTVAKQSPLLGTIKPFIEAVGVKPEETFGGRLKEYQTLIQRKYLTAEETKRRNELGQEFAMAVFPFAGAEDVSAKLAAESSAKFASAKGKTIAGDIIGGEVVKASQTSNIIKNTEYNKTTNNLIESYARGEEQIKKLETLQSTIDAQENPKKLALPPFRRLHQWVLKRTSFPPRPDQRQHPFSCLHWATAPQWLWQPFPRHQQQVFQPSMRHT